MTTFGISKELVVTLKYHYEKNIHVVETTMKCFFFLKFHYGFPWIFELKVVSTTDPELWHI